MRNKRLYYWVIAGVAFLILLVILHISQLTLKNMDQSVPNTPFSEHLPAPVPTVDETLCKRPYQDSSIWNIPIDWSIAKIHPMNDLMMSAFFQDSNWIGTDTSQYTPNVYLVSNNTPLVEVKLKENRFRDAIKDTAIRYGEPAGIVRLPLPSDARPAVGTDGQLVVINLDTDEEWGLNNGYRDNQGHWFAGGVYRYSTQNSGIPPEGFGQRGAGIGQLAGIVRRCEIDRGSIDHAVTIAYDYPCTAESCQLTGWPASIPPFRKTDGKGTSTYDIPEGARIAIRPEVTREDIAKACRDIQGCVIWILNMQKYGGFIVDNSGHPKTYAEGNTTAHWDSSVWTDDMLRHIPSDWYVVLDWNFPSTKAN